MRDKRRKATTPPGSDPPAAEQNELPERWSASRKTELVLRLLRGEAQGEESESYHRAGIVSGSGPIDQPLACLVLAKDNVSDLALVVVLHRKDGETAEDQRKKAEGALGAVVESLVQPI